MKISRRETLCGLSALGGLSLFNVGCAGFGQSRTAQLAAGGKIRIAIIGCGDWGRKLLNRAGSLGGCELVAISDPDPKAIADLYKLCGKVWSKEALAAARVFPDYRELFDNVGDELDAVFVATPNHHHALPSIMAANLGIHVYVRARDFPAQQRWI